MKNRKPIRNITPVGNQSQARSETTRRGFLKTAGLGAAGALVAGSLAPATQANEVAPFKAKGPASRVQQLKEMREAAARAAARDLESSLSHQTNGDEELYKDQAYAGNFSKTLPHDANGLVVPSAYLAFLNALRAGTQEAFDQVPAGVRGSCRLYWAPCNFRWKESILRHQD